MSRGVNREPDEESLSEGEIHDVLRNQRRRLVLEQLHEAEGGESVRDLAEYIGSVEADESPPPRNVRQSVYVALHQTHLPKLDDLGIVDYDSDEKVVTLARHADDVAIYMEVVPKYGLSWGEFFLGVALLGLATLAGARVGVPVLASVGEGALGAVFLVLVAGAAGYQVASQRSSLLHRLRGE
jgi:predicted transcriptional regulator